LIVHQQEIKYLQYSHSKTKTTFGLFYYFRTFSKSIEPQLQESPTTPEPSATPNTIPIDQDRAVLHLIYMIAETRKYQNRLMISFALAKYATTIINY